MATSLTTSGVVFPNSSVQGTAFTGYNTQTYSSAGSFTFTIPPGVFALKVTVVGGGGSGSCTTAGYYGGGAGGIAQQYLSGLTPGNTLSVTVGAGGAGVGNPFNGNVGGTSTVSSGSQAISTITAYGGPGGAGAQVAGGFAGAGLFSINPLIGQASTQNNGANGVFSKGGTSASGAPPFVAPSGAGGGGAPGNGYNASQAGGTGAVLFEW